MNQSGQQNISPQARGVISGNTSSGLKYQSHNAFSQNELLSTRQNQHGRDDTEDESQSQDLSFLSSSNNDNFKHGMTGSNLSKENTLDSKQTQHIDDNGRFSLYSQISENHVKISTPNYQGISSNSIAQNQKLAETFLTSLEEFNRIQGQPLSSCPLINDRKVNPYKLYIAVKKYGGYSSIVKNNHWHLIAHDLDIDDSEGSLRAIANIFAKFIQPFDLHVQSRINADQEPLKSQNQVIDQKQLQLSMSDQSLEEYTYRQQLEEQQQNLQKLMQNLSENEKLLNPGNIISADQKPLFPLRNNTRTVPIYNPDNPQNLQDTYGVREFSKNDIVPNLQVKPNPLIKLPHEKNQYIPKKRKIEFKGGYDVQVLSRIGTDVDSLSPEFPLFQELGTVNIHATTLGLKSQISSEVRQALDKLALVSSNPSQSILLQECPGLANALGNVGLDLLTTLQSKQISKNSKFDGLNNDDKDKKMEGTGEEDGEEEDDDDDEPDLITSVFNAYHKWDSSEKDVSFYVDSLTGDPAVSHSDQTAINSLEKTIQEDDTKFDDELVTNDDRTYGLKDSGETERKIKNFGFPTYIDLLDLSKNELDSLHKSKRTHSSSFWKEVLLDRLICVTMILRNLSFTDTNQSSLVEEPMIMKFVFGLIRSIAENPNLIHLKRRQLSIHKDLITLLANLGLSVTFPSAADSFCALLLILSFSAEPYPFRDKWSFDSISSDNENKNAIYFGEYNPTVHRYLGCAVDALAKIIPRDPPNRTFFHEIFLNTCTDEEYLMLLEQYLQGRKLQPFEFLTKVFALVISTVPRSDFRVIPKALELRIPLLHQSLLVAENLVSMIPEYGFFNDIILGYSSLDNDKRSTGIYQSILEEQKKYNVSLKWLDAIEGFGPTLLRASCVLGAILQSKSQVGNGNDRNPFSNVTKRSVSILRELGEKAMLFETSRDASCDNNYLTDINFKTEYVSSANEIFNFYQHLPPGILPTTEALFGALLTSNMNEAVVSQLCQFSEEGINYIRVMKRAKRK